MFLSDLFRKTMAHDWYVKSYDLGAGVIRVMCRTTGLLGTVKAVTYEEQVRAMRAKTLPYPWVDPSRVEIDTLAASRSQLRDLRRKSGRLPRVTPSRRIE